MIERHIKWIMVAAGILTCTMMYAILAPQAATKSMFGGSLSGPGADIVVRNWGALVTLAGIMLIYGAFIPHVRKFALVIVTISKCTFIALVTIFGQGLSGQIWVSVFVDVLFVALFAGYLLSSLRQV